MGVTRVGKSWSQKIGINCQNIADFFESFFYYYLSIFKLFIFNLYYHFTLYYPFILNYFSYLSH